MNSRTSAPDALVATRRSLHAVAEMLLAGHQHRVAGTIRLAVQPGGFRTLPLPGQPSLLAVRATDLVVTTNAREVVIAISGRLDVLAKAAGLEVGTLASVYSGGSGAMGSDVVNVDPAAATTLEHAFELGDAAMRLFGSRHVQDDPPVPVLWPEHFDVGIVLDEVNYGVSPGDDEIPEPYAYVGPHAPRHGPFWDRSFGAARVVSSLGEADAIVEFFEAGRAAAAVDQRVS
ncbi:MAG TPA: hypothetical protein VES02_10885 [Dermatophilaceae bacterium]|nr:hypothetical protein [Dermatophilaceae bacterium]